MRDAAEFADCVIGDGICTEAERPALEAIAEAYEEGRRIFAGLEQQSSATFQQSALYQLFADEGIPLRSLSEERQKRKSGKQKGELSLLRRGRGQPQEWQWDGFIWRAADLWAARGQHPGTAEGQCPDSPFQRFCAELLSRLDAEAPLPKRKKFRDVLERRNSRR